MLDGSKNLISEMEKIVKQAQTIDAQIENPQYATLFKKHKKCLSDATKASTIMETACPKILVEPKTNTYIQHEKEYMYNREKRINALYFFLESVLLVCQDSQQTFLKMKYTTYLLENIGNVFNTSIASLAKQNYPLREKEVLYKKMITYYAIIKKYHADIKPFLDTYLNNSSPENVPTLFAEELKKRLYGLYLHLFLVQVNYVLLCHTLKKGSESEPYTLEQYSMAKYLYAYLKTHLEPICSIAQHDLQKAQSDMQNICQQKLGHLHFLDNKIEPKPYEKCWLEADAYVERFEIKLNTIHLSSTKGDDVLSSPVGFENLRCITLLMHTDPQTLLKGINSNNEFLSSMNIALDIEWHDNSRVFFLLPKISALIEKWISVFKCAQEDYAALIAQRLETLKTKLNKAHHSMRLQKIPEISDALELEVMMIDAKINHPQYIDLVEKYQSIISDQDLSSEIIKQYFNKIRKTETKEKTLLETLSVLQKRINVSHFYIEQILSKHFSNLESRIPHYGIMVHAINNYFMIAKPTIQMYDAMEYYYAIFKKYQPDIEATLEKVINKKAALSCDAYLCYIDHIRILAIYISLSGTIHPDKLDLDVIADAKYLIAFCKTHLEKIAATSSTPIENITEEITIYEESINDFSTPPKPFEKDWEILYAFADSFTETLVHLGKSTFTSSLEENDFLSLLEELNTSAGINIALSCIKANDCLRSCSREQTKQLLIKLRDLFSLYQTELKSFNEDYARLMIAIIEKLRYKIVEISVQFLKEDMAKPKPKPNTIDLSTPPPQTTQQPKASPLAVNSNTPIQSNTIAEKKEPTAEYKSPSFSTTSSESSGLYDIKKLPKAKNTSQPQQRKKDNKPEHTQKPKDKKTKVNNTQKNAKQKTQSKSTQGTSEKTRFEVKQETKNKETHSEDKYLSRDHVASIYSNSKQLIFTKPASQQNKVPQPQKLEQTFPVYAQKTSTQENILSSMDVEHKNIEPKIDTIIDNLSTQIAQLSLEDSIHIPYKPTNLTIDIYNPVVVEILKLLNQAGYWAFLVGGAVEDLLLGRMPHDWDITTNYPKEKLRSLINNAKVNLLDSTKFKVGSDIDIFCSAHTIEEVFYNRDFYEKALYADCKGRIYDIANKSALLLNQKLNNQLHLIGNPYERFRNDPSLISRLVQYSTKDNKKTSRYFRAIQSTKECYTDLASGIYTKTFEKLFGKGKGLATWQTLKYLKINKYLLPGAESKQRHSNLRPCFLFIESKLFEADNCSAQEREQKYSPYHYIAWQLLPDLVDKQICEPNINFKQHLTEVIDYFLDNYQGEFNAGDKNCFKTHLEQRLPECYSEYKNVRPLYEEHVQEELVQRNFLLTYAHYQREKIQNNNNNLIVVQENGSSLTI